MSHESTKTRLVRPADFAEKYLKGRVIDIGCGPDPIVPHAEGFDLEDGDAQTISRYRPVGSYDAVCSSHCLEHMRDVPAAVADWWSLLRPGGYLVTVVPDEDLYEQGGWPSLFNPDHKATFRLDKPDSWSPVSYDIRQVIGALPDVEIVSVTRQSQRYDQRLRRTRLGPLNRFMFKLKLRLLGALRRLGLGGNRTAATLDAVLRPLGAPIDQTAGEALAQFEVIARKRPH
jgi:SAM-dependent methyltransferase